MKNLILIKSSKSPLATLSESLQSHHKQHQACAFNKRPFQGSGLIVLIYPNLTISRQLALLKSINSKWPKLSVIFAGKPLSSNEIILMFREGLADYLIEPVDVSDLMGAYQGLNQRHTKDLFNTSDFNLSKREFEVCKLLVEGLNGKMAAEYLQITPATVKVHKSRVMCKLGVTNLPDLVRIVGSQ